MSKRRSRKLKRILRAPYHVTVNTAIGLKDAIVQILAFVGLTKRRRSSRNPEFDRAGREHGGGGGYVDLEAAANLNKADRVRDNEILTQVRYENRVFRRKSSEAEELKKAMIEDSLSVSQGAAINHLAEVNRRAKEKQKSKKQAEEKESNEE